MSAGILKIKMSRNERDKSVHHFNGNEIWCNKNVDCMHYTRFGNLIKIVLNGMLGTARELLRISSLSNGLHAVSFERIILLVLELAALLH
jgi:hypothetical protein